MPRGVTWLSENASVWQGASCNRTRPQASLAHFVQQDKASGKSLTCSIATGHARKRHARNILLELYAAGMQGHTRVHAKKQTHVNTCEHRRIDAHARTYAYTLTHDMCTRETHPHT